jgi:CelD/BcsL family acetyltransferase involved in cellulose biosynthesis
MRKLPADSGFELTQTAEDLRRNFPVLIDLHNRRWDTRGGSDALASSPLQAFHEDFSRIALDRGWLRLFTLRLGERPAAAVYGFHRNGKTLYYQSGVDPTDSAHSLGLVALGFSIRHAIEEGAEEFDFLHGNEDYKFLWTNTTRELLTTDLYRRSWRGRLSMHSHRAIRAARRMARYVVGRR